MWATSGAFMVDITSGVGSVREREYFPPTYERRGKRALDLFGALIGIVIAAPVMAALYLILSLGGGDPIYGQRRIGRGGRRFTCLKFRTMRRGADVEIERMILSCPKVAKSWTERQKLAHDPRVTRIGSHLRRWGLDELPQLFNVLRGDMSLVGPRPVAAPEAPGGGGADKIYFERPEFAAYLLHAPGLTGLWQVSGGTDVSYEERIRLDTGYVDRWSLWLDLRIIAMTPLALVKRKSS